MIAGFGWIPNTTPHVVAPIPTQTPAQLATAFAATPSVHPPPRPNPYDMGWDGKHDLFIYSAETLLDFPAVPVFQQGGNK